jgi:hypothetical protein
MPFRDVCHLRQRDQLNIGYYHRGQDPISDYVEFHAEHYLTFPRHLLPPAKTPTPSASGGFYGDALFLAVEDRSREPSILRKPGKNVGFTERQFMSSA